VQRLGFGWMTGNLAPAASAAVPAAEAAGIHKQFGSTQALRGVDLTLWPGRCLGLVGRNGAGKSTLVSILSGIYPADRGEVRFDGAPAPALGAAGAWRRQIATVFQHSMVVPGLTVAENVFLGRQPQRVGLVDWRRMRDQAAQIMSEWGFSIDVNLACADLTVEQRQIVEIARALAAGTRCLLLDEPTAALERAGIERLFGRVRQLTASGVAILYISHHLEEVFEICQDVAVIRDGELVLTGAASGLSKDQMVAAMVGPDVAATRADLAPSSLAAGGGEVAADATRNGQARGRAAGPELITGPAEPCLVVDHVSSGSPGGRVTDVSLEVRPGERVGVTGLLSAGVATLARIVAGAAPYEAGRVLVAGTELTPGRRDLNLKAGVGYIPEDRQAEGFVAALSVAENATMTITDWLARVAGFLRPSARAAAAAPLARRLSIVSAGLGQISGELSGGNQQKVTVARALARKPRLIVAITPTRGVDVASKSLLLAELARVAGETGAGLLLASDELDDLVICDRVIVLVRGERFTEFTEPPFDREALIAAGEGLARGAGLPPDSDSERPR
jgi:simple sugar transport system ATP-binding protein